MKTIAFLNHSDFWGGAEANLYEIATGLGAQGYDVWVVEPSGGMLKRRLNTEYVKSYTLEFPSFHASPLGVLQNSFEFIREFKHFCTKVKPDVIISNSARCNIYATFARLFVCNVAQVWMLHEYQISKLHLRTFRSLPRYFIAVSKSVRDYYRLPNTVVIPNAFSIDNQDLCKSADARLPSTGPFTIGWFGRFVRCKGVIVLLEALRKLNGTNITLRLYGAETDKEPEYYQEVRDFVNKNRMDSMVSFCGFTSDVIGAMRNIDLVVASSVSKYGGPESFGRTVVEAMIAGAPVIATNSGGAADVVENEVNGLLVKEADSDALASAILRLYNSPQLRERLSHNARHSLEKYSTQQVISDYIRLLESING